MSCTLLSDDDDDDKPRYQFSARKTITAIPNATAMHVSKTEVGTKETVRIGASDLTTMGEAVGTGGGRAETGEPVAGAAETVGPATGATRLGVAATGAGEFVLLCFDSC